MQGGSGLAPLTPCGVKEPLVFMTHE
jgi:hypothetical protein